MHLSLIDVERFLIVPVLFLLSIHASNLPLTTCASICAKCDCFSSPAYAVCKLFVVTLFFFLSYFVGQFFLRKGDFNLAISLLSDKSKEKKKKEHSNTNQYNLYNNIMLPRH